MNQNPPITDPDKGAAVFATLAVSALIVLCLIALLVYWVVMFVISLF